MSSGNWIQFKLVITEPARHTEHFYLIKNEIIPFINHNSIPFWVTNYKNPNEDFILFRVKVNGTQLNTVNTFLNDLINRTLLVRYETSTWSPSNDAESRINGLSKIKGFNPSRARIESVTDKKINFIPDSNIDERKEQFTALFESLGECTKAIYSRLHSKPKDKWIMSVFIHLLLNSLDYSGPSGDCEENRIRHIPPI